MSTQTLDLTQTAPTSPKQRVGGYVILARMADKARADFLGGNIGDYHTDCPLDNYLLGFKGVPYSDVKQAIIAGADDAAIAKHLDSHGVSKTPEEVKAWSDGMDAAPLSGLYGEDADKKAYFEDQCKQLGLDFNKATVFDWLDADDKASHKA